MSVFRLILTFTCLSWSDVWRITARNYVYQKDVSEQCRRRVVPSVFLGRRVVEAHSQVLDFSRMELPYSCFISIRAESGNSIVLVVQLSEDSLSRACTEDSSQLVVYEIGETFGGYWGPLPDSIVRQTPAAKPSGPVTRQTTQDGNLDEGQTYSTDQTTITYSKTGTTSERPKEGQDGGAGEGDFIRVEVPLVDVIGVEVDDPAGVTQQAIDPDETFDFLYDVTPKIKGKYQTEIFPVVQFSIRQDDGSRGEETRFDLDYEAPIYTPDARLKFLYEERTTKRRKAPVTNSYVNRLLKFKHTRKSHPVKGTFNLFPAHEGVTTINAFKMSSLSTKASFTFLNTHDINNWDYVRKISKNLNHRTPDVEKYQNEKNVTKMNHNNSAYLVSDWESLVDQNKSNINVTQGFNAFTKIPSSLNYGPKNIYQFRRKTAHPKLMFRDIETTEIRSFTNRNKAQNKVRLAKKYYKDDNNLIANVTTSRAAHATHLNYDKKTTESIQVANHIAVSDANRNDPTLEAVTSYKSNTKLSGSLVGHESWENVVQAAPEMAVLLNKTVKISTHIRITNADKILQDSATVSKKKKVRKKRNIQVIPIENARPHRLITRALQATTTAATFGFSDMEEFAQLVELQDDELHDRVALRYLRQYVGPSLFNLCADRELKAKHVFLFNSSRVVMAVTNFTLERMTVILTPARTLIGGAMCSQDSLECQVYGTRICIDTMNACDGVPNCGAYDIYDEDRVICGEAGGLRHNVYLAAVAFLALLLIAMYAVHYWLKRCLPRVSEAFFIYTEGAENVLYLDPIMRSPHAIGDSMQETVHRRRSSNDSYFNSEVRGQPNNALCVILKACFNFCKCVRKNKQVPVLDIADLNAHHERRKRFSFAELELNRMMYHTEKNDAAIQTGDSLEMRHINVMQIKDSIELMPVSSLANVSTVTLDDEAQKHTEELNFIKFSKDARSPSRDVPKNSQRKNRLDSIEEELETHTYEPLEQSQLKLRSLEDIKITCKENPSTSKHSEKLLRFVEEPTEIPCLDDEGIQESNIELEDRKKKDNDLDKEESASREFRFWKSKKSKKKTHLSIR